MKLQCLLGFEVVYSSSIVSFFFFFNDTATTEIYTLSLHDALPISDCASNWHPHGLLQCHHGRVVAMGGFHSRYCCGRSEEHTSELQSQSNLVCRLLLEKKKTNVIRNKITPSA